MRIAEQDIGGGRVRHAFTMGSNHLKAGYELSSDMVRSIPSANRNALIDAGMLEVFPRPQGQFDTAPLPLHAFHIGGGRFDLIAGRKVNSEPVTREEADAAVRKSREEGSS
jgi:hypothetical protein